MVVVVVVMVVVVVRRRRGGGGGGVLGLLLVVRVVRVYGLAHVTGREPYILHHLEPLFWVVFVPLLS